MGCYRPGRETEEPMLQKLFINHKGKYPEDDIKVSEAIDLFFLWEACLFVERDGYREALEKRCGQPPTERPPDIPLEERLLVIEKLRSYPGKEISEVTER